MNLKTRPILAAAAGLAFIATVLAANWAIGHLGTAPHFPDAPHTIKVGFGWSAPSGVLFVSLALVLRDLFQYALGGRRGSLRMLLAMLALIGAGAGLSYGVSASSVATASALAFGFSELADFVVFTLIAPRWSRAVLAGGIVGAVIDSWIFLAVAFSSLNFIQGQILGKVYGVVAAAIIIAARRFYFPDRNTPTAPWPITMVDCPGRVKMQAAGDLAHRCPYVGEYDNGVVVISWITNGSTIELHSLASWLRDFEPVSISHEALVGHIADTIAAASAGRIGSVLVTYRTVTAGMEISTAAWL